MKSENWLLCHAHAYEYFGGVPRLLIPDNLKTGVTKNTRLDTVINRSYAELADHYGAATVPARFFGPGTKAMRKAQSPMHPHGSWPHCGTKPSFHLPRQKKP